MRRYDFKEGGTSYLPEHQEGRFVLYTGIEQGLQQARREGWEQAKREARGKLSARYERYLTSETIYILNEIECCERTIAAMEYKEKAND